MIALSLIQPQKFKEAIDSLQKVVSVLIELESGKNDAW